MRNHLYLPNEAGGGEQLHPPGITSAGLDEQPEPSVGPVVGRTAESSPPVNIVHNQIALIPPNLGTVEVNLSVMPLCLSVPIDCSRLLDHTYQKVLPGFPSSSIDGSPPSLPSSHVVLHTPFAPTQLISDPSENRIELLKRKHNLRKCNVVVDKLSEAEIENNCRRTLKACSPLFETPSHPERRNHVKMSNGIVETAQVELKIMKTPNGRNDYVVLPSPSPPTIPWQQYEIESSKFHSPLPYDNFASCGHLPKSDQLLTNVLSTKVEQGNRNLSTSGGAKGSLPQNEFYPYNNYVMWKYFQGQVCPSPSRWESSNHPPRYMRFLGRSTEDIGGKKIPKSKKRRERATGTIVERMIKLERAEIVKKLPRTKTKLPPRKPKIILKTTDFESIFDAVIKGAQGVKADTYTYEKEPQRASFTPTSLSTPSTELCSEREVDADTLTGDELEQVLSEFFNPQSCVNPGEKIDVGNVNAGITNCNEQQTLFESIQLLDDIDDLEKCLGSKLFNDIVEEGLEPEIPIIQKITEKDPEPLGVNPQISVPPAKIERGSSSDDVAVASNASSPGSDVLFLCEIQKEDDLDILTLYAENEELPLPLPLCDKSST